MILRLPEERDYYGEGPDPVSKFRETQRSTKDFFSKKPKERINKSEFGRNNYLTAPKNSVGVPSHKVYYTKDVYRSGGNSTQDQFFDRRSTRASSEYSKK